MKLIIQIPCLNEEAQLPVACAELPRSVKGFDTVEWMIIDDGSSDRTIEVALESGIDHVVKLPQNQGLAAAFQVGLDAALKLGADVIVNTDADNQYDAQAIPTLIAPILDGTADLVIGDRDVASVEEFSFIKQRLQLLGSWVVRVASGTDVPDTTSGFRAYSRESALRLTVVNKYTYTIESIIQAGKNNSAISHVPVGTNPKMRESRLFGSVFGYIRRNSLTILRVFAAYEPLKFFGFVAVFLGIASFGAFIPFLSDWLLNGDRTGHLQSIIVGAVLAIGSIQVLVLAIVADLIASHRTVSQRVLERVKRLELHAGIPPSYYFAGKALEETLPVDDDRDPANDSLGSKGVR